MADLKMAKKSIMNIRGSLVSSVIALLLLVGCDSLKPKPDPAAASSQPPSSAANPDNENEPEADTSGDDSAENSLPPVALEGSQTGSNRENPIAAPSGAEQGDPAANAVDQEEFQRQLLEGLDGLDTNDPQQLIGLMQKADTSIQDLMSASANNIVDEGTFRESGVALGQIKLAAARKLATSPTATPEQQKAGKLAQLVALSHLSGFRDVEAAKELEKYALELSASSDLDLAHQSRVVLMGFQLQALQNGLATDPNDLLAQAEGLFARPEDRSFPELMMLLQSNQVLNQMGFKEAANRINEILVEEFSDASDPQLRAEAWNIQTRGSQALENYLIAFRSLGSSEFDQVAAIAAARGLFEAFPSVQTLEQLAGTVTNIEYDGNLQLSQQLVELIDQKLAELPGDASVDAINSILAGHRARLGLLGKALPLDGIVQMNGQPFDWSEYRGKVVLVDFWATWCVPCLKEIPEIRKAYSSLKVDGFEVISVNMDDSISDAEAFLSKQSFPWKTFRSGDSNALGFKSQFAKELGISAIPFMILLDQEGKVAAIHVRGEKLTPAVREMLGLPTSLIPEE